MKIMLAICELCNTQFQQERSRNRFCSRRCSNTFTSRARYGKQKELVESLTHKICNACGVEKLVTDYSNNRKLLGGRQNTCKLCLKEAKLKLRYAITQADYDMFYLQQNGKCKICKKVFKILAVDHDHKCCPGEKSCGKCIRGLLCGNCNLAIGLLGEDPEILIAAMRYLNG